MILTAAAAQQTLQWFKRRATINALIEVNHLPGTECFQLLLSLFTCKLLLCTRDTSQRMS
jgi:hypothetical protein